ncbi:MAG: DUF932 domain-containing protein [Deltaproteobacteria bacterium]|nr:DUF932 domain-containing protein [Deltaproteobacteria bacterium]
MPANVGEMFYYGNVPWHGEGHELSNPANIQEAIKAGGLDWEVGMVPLKTAEDPPSMVDSRVAIVRKDRPKGEQGRVIGVTHKGFKPLQNREGLRIFDSIFGKGKKAYHTGGYLGRGEVIWLLAGLPGNIVVGKKDTVKPYALFTNSHNGSIAIDVRLTTVRVVCQNTLSLALMDKDKKTFFKHAHQGDYQHLQSELETFFCDTLKAVDNVQAQFKEMMERKFDDDVTKEYIEKLFPVPIEPASSGTNKRVRNQYLTRVKKVRTAREKIAQLRLYGKGTDLPGVKESLWGTFNAVLEYVDHYERDKGTGISWSLFGSGAVLKRKAYCLSVDFLQHENLE